MSKWGFLSQEGVRWAGPWRVTGRGTAAGAAVEAGRGPGCQALQEGSGCPEQWEVGGSGEREGKDAGL